MVSAAPLAVCVSIHVHVVSVAMGVSLLSAASASVQCDACYTLARLPVYLTLNYQVLDVAVRFATVECMCCFVQLHCNLHVLLVLLLLLLLL